MKLIFAHRKKKNSTVGCFAQPKKTQKINANACIIRSSLDACYSVPGTWYTISLYGASCNDYGLYNRRYFTPIAQVRAATPHIWPRQQDTNSNHTSNYASKETLAAGVPKTHGSLVPQVLKGRVQVNPTAAYGTDVPKTPPFRGVGRERYKDHRGLKNRWICYPFCQWVRPSQYRASCMEVVWQNERCGQ